MFNADTSAAIDTALPTLPIPAPFERIAFTPPASPAEGRCSACRMRDGCLPGNAAGDGTSIFDRLPTGRRKVAAGDALCHEGGRFEHVYAVRIGSFKSSLTLADGREQISGFHLPGDLIGFDGVANGHHASNATALEDSEVCVIPYARLADGGVAGHQAVARLMSRDMVRQHTQMLVLGSMTADERLAAFLLSFAERLGALGYSASEFHLRMSRAEIGSYLGLTLETVSRTFSSFQQRGWLKVDKRHVRIVEPMAFKRAFQARVH